MRAKGWTTSTSGRTRAPMSTSTLRGWKPSRRATPCRRASRPRRLGKSSSASRKTDDLLLAYRALFELDAQPDKPRHPMFERLADSPRLGHVLDQDHGADEPVIQPA